MGRAIRILITASLLAATASLAAVAGDVAEDILARSIERYNAGELQPAIGGISAALRSRLTGASLAKAYLYRGLAYRKSGQPGLAITDLTRALEYSSLTDSERSEAGESLQVAYQEAGISSSERVLVGPAEDEQRRPAASKIAAMPKTEMPPASSVPVTGSLDARRTAASAESTKALPWQTETASSPAPPTEPPRWTATQVALAPLPPIAPPVKAPAPATPPERGKQSAAVRRAPPPVAQQPAVTQPAVARPAVAPPAVVQTPELPRWSAPKVAVAPPPPVEAPAKAIPPLPVPVPAQAVAVRSEPPPAVQRAAARPLAPLPPFTTQVAAQAAAVPEPPAPPSAVNLLIGDARSRSEAFALAVRLTSQRGAGLGRRLPQIAETKFADASVYRLRLGPFADASQALALCRSLRDSGYECVTE